MLCIKRIILDCHGRERGVHHDYDATPSVKKRMFYGTVVFDPVKAKLQFSNVAEEVILLFAQRPDVKVKISIKNEVGSSSGFDDGIQRSDRENCDQ